MNTRNTRQKEIIFETLQELRTHPTILELYEAVQKKDFSIGQATVYRNVSKLIEEGKIRKVLTHDGIDHYDGDCSKHSHFMCRSCHRLFDLWDVNTASLIKQQQKSSSFDITEAYVLFEGICNQCK